MVKSFSRALRSMALVLVFAISLLPTTPALAGPIYGLKSKQDLEYDRTTRLFTPDAYNNIPAGRAGGTIGLAVIPRLTEKSDDAEQAIATLVGHIPAINMVITLPPNDPLYLFKFLKHLKATGKRIDLLFIGGHALQYIENDNVFAIKLGADERLRFSPSSMDVGAIQRELDQLITNKTNPVRKKELCDKLKLIRDGSSAFVPGAQLILHSCYLGNSDQTVMMSKFATGFLGVNGGSAVGPKFEVKSLVMGDKNPSGIGETIIDTLQTRALQVSQSIKSRRFVKLGDAFISTQWFTEQKIAAGKIKVPSECDSESETDDKGSLIRTAPEIEKVIRTNEYEQAQVSLAGDNITWTTQNNGPHVSTLTYVAPPLNVYPGKPFKLMAHLTGDTSNNMQVQFQSGFGFSTEYLGVDFAHPHLEKDFVTPVRPSARQKEQMWISLYCGCGASSIKQTWHFNENGQQIAKPPVTRMRSIVSPVENAGTKSATTTVEKAHSGNALFKRTGPFITQTTAYKNDSQVTLGTDQITWTGSDMFQKGKVSCTLKYDPPPEELSIGDDFSLGMTLTGHEDQSPRCFYMVGWDWIKSTTPIQDKTISLSKDSNIPSMNSTCQVVDYKKTIQELLKKNPDKVAAATKEMGRLPVVKLFCAGPVNVNVEWRYTR